jgi:hypothetical protein
MANEKYTYGGVKLTRAAAENIESFLNPVAYVQDDLEALGRGVTREQLLDRCLDGAEDDGVIAGWHEYVDALVRHVEAERPRSVAIRKWAGGQRVELVWQRGEADQQRTGWRRADGYRAIETNGDPIWEDDDGMSEAWRAGSE